MGGHRRLHGVARHPPKTQKKHPQSRKKLKKMKKQKNTKKEKDTKKKHKKKPQSRPESIFFQRKLMQSTQKNVESKNNIKITRNWKKKIPQKRTQALDPKQVF